MTCDAAVTFEYATRAPETVRLKNVTAGQAQTVAAKAVRAARREIRPVSWVSAVVVLTRHDE